MIKTSRSDTTAKRTAARLEYAKMIATEQRYFDAATMI